VDITADTQEDLVLNIPSDVYQSTIENALKEMPNGKAPGPDGIQNEVLQMVCLGITKPLAEVIGRHFADRTLPETYKELTTVVL